MIRAIIFDIGNVLLRFDFSVALERVAAYCRTPVAGIFERIEPSVALYESGRMGRAEFLREVVALLEYGGSEEEFVAAWADIFEENRPMTQLVEGLYGRYPLHLLSNTSDIHMDFILPRYPLFERFSDAVYSYRAGCRKPEREIFELAARQFGVNPCETVFIDDLSINVEGARAVGFHAIAYDYRRHEAFLEELARLGVVLP